MTLVWRGTRKAVCLALLTLAMAGTGDFSWSQSAGEAAPERISRADKPLTKAQLEQRLNSIGFLLEKSSAARQIEASGNAAAQARRADALARYRAAQEASKADDLVAATKLLAEAGALLTEGARLANPAEVKGDKERADFDARLASVRALLAADQRVLAEKHAEPGAAEAVRSIEKRIAEAGALARAGKLAEGRELLDQAYLLTRAALSSLRRGDTLTRSVHFATKEEEYQHELGRNDSHRALLQSLLGQMSREVEGMVGDAAVAASQLRREAERSKGAGDAAAAVELLEKSTREFLRAIRGLGISVPG